MAKAVSKSVEELIELWSAELAEEPARPRKLLSIYLTPRSEMNGPPTPKQGLFGTPVSAPWVAPWDEPVVGWLRYIGSAKWFVGAIGEYSDVKKILLKRIADDNYLHEEFHILKKDANPPNPFK